MTCILAPNVRVLQERLDKTELLGSRAGRSPLFACPSSADALAPPQRDLLRCASSATPGEEFVEACALVIGDLGEAPCQLGLWANLVELGGFNQGEGQGLAAALEPENTQFLRPIIARAFGICPRV